MYIIDSLLYVIVRLLNMVMYILLTRGSSNPVYCHQIAGKREIARNVHLKLIFLSTAASAGFLTRLQNQVACYYYYFVAW